MKGLAKRIALIFVTAVLAVTAIGCSYDGYDGKYKGAYTLICAQVPDTLGARTQGPFLKNPQILCLETDNKGRGMYLYLEDTDGFLSLGIVQKEEVDRVYFYPEQSTISFRLPDRVYDIDNEKLSETELKSLLSELCSADALEQFKADNDWNAPMCEEKLDSAPIFAQKISVRWEHRKDEVNLSNNEWGECVSAFANKNGHDVIDEGGVSYYFSHSSWMATDKYGRRMYYVEGYYYVYQDVSNVSYVQYTLEMVAIINPDGSYDENVFMVELLDKESYQEQIRALKEANGWNQP